MERIEAHVVDKLGRFFDVPDSEIALLSLFERADIESSQRTRCFSRNAGDALVHSQAEARRGHVHGKQKRGERRGAGIAIGGNGDGNGMLPEQFDRRQSRFPKKIEGARQKNGRRICARERDYAVFACPLKMIG